MDAAPGTPDGFRVDVDGNLWCGWGMGDPELDGVRIFNPEGQPIGHISLPERCANLCFGGRWRNRAVHGLLHVGLRTLRQHTGCDVRLTARVSRIGNGARAGGRATRCSTAFSPWPAASSGGRRIRGDLVSPARGLRTPRPASRIRSGRAGSVNGAETSTAPERHWHSADSGDRPPFARDGSLCTVCSKRRSSSAPGHDSFHAYSDRRLTGDCWHPRRMD